MKRKLDVLMLLGVMTIAGLLIACYWIKFGMIVFTLSLISFCGLSLHMAFSLTSLEEISSAAEKRAAEYKDQKKYGRMAIYQITVPLMMVGIAFAVLLSVVMIMNLFK